MKKKKQKNNNTIRWIQSISDTFSALFSYSKTYNINIH